MLDLSHPLTPSKEGELFFVERAHDDVAHPFDPKKSRGCKGERRSRSPLPKIWIELAAKLPIQSPIVIVGTDTDVGKTWVTGHLAHAFYETGVPVITQKWVQTGPAPTDIDTHDRLSGVVFPAALLTDRLPYYFPDPVSPHLAASRQGQCVDTGACLAATARLQAAGYRVLIEGSGGLMVPYTETVMLLDMVADAGFSVLLVSENRVGVINQVMLSVMALRQRGISLLGIVLSQKNLAHDADVMADNVRMVANGSRVRVWSV